MSAIKGQAKAELSDFSKYVGFGKVTVVGVNPDRSELNKFFDKDDSDTDKPIDYLGEDNDGNTKVKLSFLLREEKLNKLFFHNITLVKKERTNQTGDKYQWINNVLDTGWDSDGNNLPDFFTKFLNKEDEIMGEKKYKKALIGEEALGIFIKAWQGKLDFNHPQADVNLDRKKLFAGNFKELKELVLPDNADEEEMKASMARPFVALFGVKTDSDDSTKQYQQIFPRGFLPPIFIKYINNGMKWPNDYIRKQWVSFEKKVVGTKDDAGIYRHGWDSYYEFGPLVEYDKSKDVAAQSAPKEEITDGNDKY